jgi:hypothetical protein
MNLVIFTSSESLPDDTTIVSSWLLIFGCKFYFCFSLLRSCEERDLISQTLLVNYIDEYILTGSFTEMKRTGV